jgi:hypothetical protein
MRKFRSTIYEANKKDNSYLKELSAMTDLRIESWDIQVSDLGPENPLPQLRSDTVQHISDASPDVPEDMIRHMAYGRLPNIMPYPMQDGYTRGLKTTPVRMGVLENDYLRAAFLLEYGGRLWSLVYKPIERELLYRNKVIQLGNLALRNAWFCGGVEWNIGTTGHTPFTCAPLFVSRVMRPDGIPVLRMYEWERCRQVPYQIDAFLPDGSPVLYVHVRVINPHRVETPLYWWSNIAVPENEKTRVIVPAEAAYHFSDNSSKVILVPTPEHDGLDYSYPTGGSHSSDYFFHIPPGRRPYITALDERGVGLVQTSTARLQGRKLFFWGTGSGGSRWQRFLSPAGGRYLEIQAGLARTQMEHLAMPGHVDWNWLEVYGMLEVDPQAAHSDDWHVAQQRVQEKLERLIPACESEDQFVLSSRYCDLSPAEILQRGSGWGALERMRREVSGEPQFCPDGLVFDDASLGDAQAPWVDLLTGGRFKGTGGDAKPGGFMVQSEWLKRVAASLHHEPDQGWVGWFHLGNMLDYANDRKGAIVAWENSLKRTRTPGVLRNLALAAYESGDLDRATALYREACALAPKVMPLEIEYGTFLIKTDQPRLWLEHLGNMAAEIRSVGRIQLLEAQAYLKIGALDQVKRFLDEGVVIPELQEGEETLTNLWFAYHASRLSREERIPQDSSLMVRVREEYPVPEALDFRMTDAR